MREYVYFSDRLASKILEDNPRGRRSGRKVTFAVRPGGLGGDTTTDWQAPDPEARHSRAEQIDEIIADDAATLWDPNQSAHYLRGRSRAFLGEVVRRPGEHERTAMVGSVYKMDGVDVSLCLFGSRGNLDGAVPGLDPGREFGWFSSSTQGVTQLLRLASTDGPWDSAGVDSDSDASSDLAWTAANIMRTQGLVGNDGRRNSRAPSLRGYTILEGDFEWLARIYYWSPGDIHYGNIAVGAPVYVRTFEEALVTYPTADDQVTRGKAPLAIGMSSPDDPQEFFSPEPRRQGSWRSRFRR